MNARLKEKIYPYAWRLLTHLGLSRVDYHTHHAKRDLEKKYKILAGCSSAEEFDETGQRTLQILVSLA